MSYEIIPNSGWSRFPDAAAFSKEIILKANCDGWTYMNPTSNTFILENGEYGETVYLEFNDAEKETPTKCIVGEKETGSREFKNFVVFLLEKYKVLKRGSGQDVL